MAAYDWEYWRHLYVSGDDAMSLEELRKRPNAPSIGSLKRRSTAESWPEQRKQFRYRAATVATQSATGIAAAQQVTQLVDAAELITRHIQLAKAIQGKAAKALRSIDPDSMAARDVLAWIKEGTQIERLALGLATERVETQIEVSTLTDEQLLKLAAGEDIEELTE
jgi:hypothetical protein